MPWMHWEERLCFWGWRSKKKDKGVKWQRKQKLQRIQCIKMMAIYACVSEGPWAPKQALKSCKYCIIILKLVRLQRNSTSLMKQHNYKTVANHKIHQNQVGKCEFKTSQENDEHHLSQEMRLSNHETQILFKKGEKGTRARGGDGLIDRRVQSQGIRLRHGRQTLPPHKKYEMFSEKLSSSERLPVKQQCDQIRTIQKGKRQSKHQRIPIGTSEATPEGASSHTDRPTNPKQKQHQRRNKKQIKLAKKNEKEKQRAVRVGGEGCGGMEKVKEENRRQIPNQLLQIFKQKYSYYLIDNKIIFPVEDHLFLEHTELQEERVGVFVPQEKLVSPLPREFSKELQIWNMLIQHSAFFEVQDELEIADIAKMLAHHESPSYKKLFKNLHKFYINDVIFQKYEESTSEEYFSFISLWRYAQENNFLDKLFHTSWNKFILFYISLQRHYTNELIISELQHFERIIRAELDLGYFTPPKEYSDLMDYLIFLINMCFETHTFKSLINNKMNFFRDNNKMKNELLEEKKNMENRLWELKENEKQVVKKEKVNVKQLKKEQKQHSVDRVGELQKENQEIYEEKTRINEEREKYQLKIIEIDNKIYELCCLPQFSNVWLLGEDKYKNLYWFIREQENAIYRECKATGEWGMIESENIELFHQQLNLRGIKEHKLYEKILYYKQLGYIKTERQDIKLEDLELPEQPYPQSPESNNSNPKPLSSPLTGKYDISEFDKFSYMQFKQITPHVIRLMILKSEWMMSKYLYERNSKWTTEQNRQEYISKMSNHDLSNFQSLTQQLRTFNERICVVQINIKIANQNEGVQNKTRKIQTKIWGINEKYKHFWYDYSRRCKTLSDLHFLVSVLYLTIEKYVTKTRKPNNTKYFFKTVEFGENNDVHEGHEHFGEEEMI